MNNLHSKKLVYNKIPTCLYSTSIGKLSFLTNTFIGMYSLYSAQ